MLSLPLLYIPDNPDHLVSVANIESGPYRLFGFSLRKSLRVDAVPALLDLGEAEAAIRALADDLEGLEKGSRAGEAIRRMAATMACHAAVKAHDPLTPEKMRYILSELERTSYSSVCPHGRPVVLRLTRREIEKNFQRI